MGSTGSGINGMPQYLLPSMLAAAQGGGAQPATQTPMANLLSFQSNGSMRPAVSGMPMQNPINQPGQQPQDQNTQALLGMLAKMAPGQTGVAPQAAQATANTPGLVWNPNNPVGTSTLGGATANPYPAAMDQSSGVGGLLASLLGRLGMGSR